jgi:phage tail sheath gpL-like
MAIQVTGFNTTTKTPGFYADTIFGAGPINIFSIPLVFLLCGLKATSSGSITPDVDVVDITSKEDADTYLGAGGECATMAYDALDEARGYQLKACCPAAAGGAVAATATYTFVGGPVTAGKSGTIVAYLDGKAYPVTLTGGMTITNCAAALRDVFLQNARASMLASANVGVTTLTDKCATIRGNQAVLYLDISQLGSIGVTVTLAGSGAVTSSTNVSGVFAGATPGAGVETLTNMHAVIYPGFYNRVAVAQNDATSLAAWLAQTNAKAAATEGRTEHLLFATNGTLSAATSLSQTTVNNQRFQQLWHKYGEARPPRMAAAFAAVRAAAEATQPNASFDDYQFVTIPSQRFVTDWVQFSTSESALGAGVTPLRSSTGAKAQMIRSITTRSLDGTTPDYRTIDTGMAVTPDFVRLYLKILWVTDFKPQNQFVAPDPAPGEAARNSGVATPKIWTTYVKRKLRDLSDQPSGRNILTQVTLSQNQPQSEYNTELQGIMSIVPVIPLPANHSQGVSVRQGAPIV